MCLRQALLGENHSLRIKNIVSGQEHAGASYRGKLVKKGYPNPHHLLDHLPKTNLII